ncbi:hypothetical protein [Natronoarchaeum philippinense]|uniref:hypothetical protein n=1 Tax=Natronoarchaeum philippinense TaxID=558529 RepID=UPI000BE38B0A|nr:hypothetical protein [Natronoarchaeum philippinense]
MSTTERSIDTEIGSAEDSWSISRTAGDVTLDGERCRVEWTEGTGIRRKALFRVASGYSLAVLQHIRTVVVQQRGDTRARLNPDARLEEVPAPLIGIMRSQGLRPVNSREVGQ